MIKKQNETLIKKTNSPKAVKLSGYLFFIYSERDLKSHSE